MINPQTNLILRCFFDRANPVALNSSSSSAVAMDNLAIFRVKAQVFGDHNDDVVVVHEAPLFRTFENTGVNGAHSYRPLGICC